MNASFLEIVQTGASGLGAFLAVRSMVAADLNLVAVRRRNVNGNRGMIAAKNVRVARSVLCVQILLFLVGVATLFLAPPPYNPAGGVPRSAIEIDIIRNLTVTRLGMTISSLILMYVSYRGWLEERLPLTVRHTDRLPPLAGTAGPALAVIAQEAASHAQATATLAKEAASEAQTTAGLAQDAATEATAKTADGA